VAHGAGAAAALEARAFAAGRAAGLAEAAATLDAVAARLGGIEDEARGTLAHAAAELAVEIARVLLRREIASGGYDIERIVRETLREGAVGRAPCVVHLHPEDHARLADARFRSGTKLAPDEGVPRGDVHVETSLGLLVRDVDGCLDAIAQRLQESLE
jgi:flagellar biosynthesis/type III secretory pathway protein FliH